MLSLVGIGLSDPKDISVKGLEIVRAADKVYLESYTSVLSCSKEELESFYGRPVLLADRECVEVTQDFFEEAERSDVALLFVGDVFSATTHVSILLDAKKRGIPVAVVHNASIMTAVGETGLSLYNFGKTSSISWHESMVPLQTIQENGAMHTLLLLDLSPEKQQFMEARDALSRLIQQGFSPEKKVLVCVKMGSREQRILYGEAKNIPLLGLYPQCIIVPGMLHFVEEEALALLG